MSTVRARTTLIGMSMLGLATLLVAGGLPQTATAGGNRSHIERTLRDPNIKESSGLARSHYSRTRLWTHNDSGGGSIIYAIGRSGRTVAKYELVNAQHWDWEAMASARHNGAGYLWVGEIGDNRTRRSTIFVHRLREPRPAAPNGTRNPRSFEFKYPDGAHDAEAILVRPGSLRIFVVSKVAGSAGHIYAAPRHPSTTRINHLRRVGTVPSGITDGVFLDRHRFVLRGYGSAWRYRTMGAKPRQFSLPHSGESITQGRRSGHVLIGSEGVYSNIWSVRLP